MNSWVARWVLGLFKLNPCLQIEFVTPGQAPTLMIGAKS